MPRSYATDLRWRAVWLHLTYNLEAAEISQQLAISPSSVYRYIALFEQTGDVKLPPWSPQAFRRYGTVVLVEGDLVPTWYLSQRDSR